MRLEAYILRNWEERKQTGEKQGRARNKSQGWGRVCGKETARS